MDRLIRKARKIRERLEAPRELTQSISFKPKGMHWDTFFRLFGESHKVGFYVTDAT